MKRNMLLMLTLFLPLGLTAQKNSFDYFGSTHPGNIPIAFAPELFSSERGKVYCFGYSPDGNEAFMQTNPILLYLLKKDNGTWGTPYPANFMDKDSIVNYFNYSPDGKQIWFSCGNRNSSLWMSVKKDGSWSKPEKLPYPINVPGKRQGGHSLTINNTLYFTSNRDDKHNCCGDIYRSKLIKGKYSEVERMDSLSTQEDEENLFISPDEKYLIVQSWRANGVGKHDFYIAYRDEYDHFTPLILMDTVINTKEHEFLPFVSFDNKYFFFDRVKTTMVDNKENYDVDIYWVSTKRIFKPYIYHSIRDTAVSVNQFFNFPIPLNTFKDYDSNTLTLSSSLSNGDKLPEWLTFDTRNNIFKGAPNKADSLMIKLTATDENLNSCSINFKLLIR
jgi:hypothetical protein